MTWRATIFPIFIPPRMKILAMRLMLNALVLDADGDGALGDVRWNTVAFQVGFHFRSSGSS
jgi:hypothetical protein